MNVETSSSLAQSSPDRFVGQITPFHIRAQIQAQLMSRCPLKQRLFNLFTQSWSKWHIRERFIASVRETLKATEAMLAKRQFSVREVSMALQEAGKQSLHIGLIADGNRRFGKLMGKGLGWGHVQGAKAIENTFLPLVSQIPQITECSLYLLSHSNLGRPEAELKKLDELFQRECQSLLTLASTHNIQYQHAGNMEGLRRRMPKMAAGLQKLVEETRLNDKLVVNLCLNYQAKTELGHATKQWAVQNLENGVTPVDVMAMDEAVVTEAVRQNTWIPRPMDLCLRTGGDHRTSGFPPNQPWNENCELTVLEKFLPQMTAQDILGVLWNFADVELRKGK